MIKNKHSFLFKASILGISIDTTAAGVISGAIPVIKDSFPGVASSAIESITTLPSLAILIFVAISPLVTKKIGYKNTASLGLLISFISGIAPAFINSIYGILVCRFLFGAGIGLLNPLSYSIVSYFYEGDERAQMFGFIGTVSNLASTLLTMLAGILLQISWRFSFLTYFILLVVLLLVIAFLPKMNIQQENKKISIVKSLKKLNGKVFAFCAAMFFMQFIFMTLMIKLSLLITDVGYGTATSASFILSFTSLTGMFVGVLFGKVHQLLGSKMFPLFILILSGSSILITFSKNLLFTGVLVIIMAASFTFLSPYMFLRISELCPKELTNFSNSLALVFINISVFLTPYIQQIIGDVIGNQTPAAAMITSGVVGLIVLIVVIWNSFGMQKNSLKNKVN
ncbi:MFS transporter [Companilactobacillus bobalius]|uniref:Major facilitator superfamily (MFS) profile domain-containing protein n=2 Tax=Companilactobacillus bobalius TaxID=2801451 RepID=A0A202F8A6_9LACO|nr:MFS transporter [Companilactobacillus bobalius]GEO58970.1 hypothetical protein LBO01_20990 [Companilactobacillus paralimentarius]KAE9559507.1 hypothetical protein ATN92_11560 [Companilactobacillus bobalius]KAE9563949.1 hypothetical protein ATN92_01905 [Companilactobacillus bobalius]KRK83622.1 major facilitator superfamily protein [Companilactobacillus bobalius DSM 19674]OVE96706.1 hypothetical protein LKACC16343_02375 [Companilactobacillus bobalius]